MRNFTILLPLFALAVLSPANAQEMYPGQDVTVNPQAAGTQVLLYPGGQYERIVRPLLMPGATPSGSIHLHMPAHHRVATTRHRAVAETQTETPVQAPVATAEPPAAETPPPVRRPARRTHVAATRPVEAPPAPEPAAPPAEPTRAANLSDLSDMESTAPAAPAPVKRERRAPPRAVEPAPTRTAVAEPPPARTTPKPRATGGGSARDVILFSAGASDPSTSAVTTIKTLADQLNGALSDGDSRVQLMAYAGAKGERTSDTRRLSLKRALVIRQLLIDDGVPAERIDVRAMGGVDDDGPLDRVDVFLKG